MDFKKDTYINPDQLDVEWLKQANLYQQYAEALAEANDELKRAEQKLKVIRSELILEASEKGEEVLGKGVKPTMQTIEAYYRTHKDHKEAKEEYFKAAKKAEMTSAAVFGMQQKKTALENMVRLLNSSYYAAPSVPRDLKEEWEKYREKAQEDTSDKFAERRRRRSE